jgi:hypothetical protein
VFKGMAVCLNLTLPNFFKKIASNLKLMMSPRSSPIDHQIEVLLRARRFQSLMIRGGSPSNSGISLGIFRTTLKGLKGLTLAFMTLRSRRLSIAR